MNPPATPATAGDQRPIAQSPAMRMGPCSQAQLDLDWEFDAPKWFDFARLLDHGDGEYDNPPPKAPKADAASMSPNPDPTSCATVPVTPGRLNRMPGTPGAHGIGTPQRTHVIAAFAETPSITKYFAKHAETPGEKPLPFISLGAHYTSDEIANCLLADFSDDNSSDAEKDSDSAASLTDYSDSDFIDTDEVVDDQFADGTVHAPAKSFPRPSFARFGTPSKADRKSLSARNTPSRRPSAVFLVYPDPDQLGNTAPLTPILGQPPSASAHKDSMETDNTSETSPSATAPTTSAPPSTPAASSAATIFHWAKTPSSAVPVFPKIATTETILYSVRKPAEVVQVVDVDSGSGSDGDHSDDDVKNMQGTANPAAGVARSSSGSGNRTKRKKQTIATRLTVPQEFSFMKRQRAPLRVVSSPVIRRRKSIKIHRPLRPTITAPTVASSNKTNTATRAAAAAHQPRIRELQHRSRGVTIPQSPKLRTKYLRKAPPSMLSAAEQEEVLLQQMQKEQFRARPLNRKIFQADHPLGVPEPKQFAPTVPHSPAITKPKPKPQAPPSPTPSASSKGSKFDGKPTQPEPFHLPGDAFTERKRQELEMRLRREEQELQRKRAFRAQPLPEGVVVSKPIVPEVHSTKPPTEPKPFSLRTDLRAAAHQGTVSTSDTTFDVPEFHARPIPPSIDNPFIPQPSNKPPTIPDLAPHLYTEDRAESRRDFDERDAQRRALEELQAQREAEERERQLRQVVKELRRQMVHRARPAPREILEGPTFVPQPSTRPVTVPESPAIGKKRKVAMVAARGEAGQEGEVDGESEQRKRARWGWNAIAPELLDVQPQIDAGRQSGLLGHLQRFSGYEEEKESDALGARAAVAAVDGNKHVGEGDDELDMTLWTMPQEDAEWLIGASSADGEGK